MFRRLIHASVLFAGFVLHLGAQPVINEIHYDPPDKTEPAEFIELHNPTPSAVNLGGWRLTGAVEFRFPAGTTIPAGGYMVVGQDPAHLQQRFGVPALGPWDGRLRNEGETIELRDPGNALVDRVSYQLGFPWPTVGEPPGCSIELIHPTLDNDLGGHWRVSVNGGVAGVERTTLVEAGSEWRFFRGVSEPSSPRAAWRAPDFSDAGWEIGALPIGYDPDLPLGTTLEDMHGQYTSVYLRRHFSVTNAATITSLEIHALYDDGFRVWINGHQVLNANLAGSDLSYTATAGPARES